MFIGTYYNKIDEKGRLRMPPKFKEELGCNYFISKGDHGCLYILSKSAFEELSRKIRAINFSDNDSKKFQRAFFSSADSVEEDNQGRFLIPQSLREYAAIAKEAVVIGSGDRIEIWSQENWDRYNAETDFDDLISGLAKYDF